MIVFSLLILSATVVVLTLTVRNLGLEVGSLTDKDVDHAKCIAHVSHYTGNEFAALLLKAAAEDYASARGQHELEVIANNEWRSEGPPVPALWLNKRADGFKAEVES